MTIVIMKKIAAGEFKSRCLRIMDVVQSTREPVLITKKGRAVARLMPAEEPSDDFLGKLAGTMKIAGDITAPIEDTKSWDALR